MSRELTAEDHRRIARAVHDGTPVPTGPVLLAFSPAALAEAIEYEVARARVIGWAKVSLHFDVDDAAAFAQWLRRADRPGRKG